jgi:hypothetical protein
MKRPLLRLTPQVADELEQQLTKTSTEFQKRPSAQPVVGYTYDSGPVVSPWPMMALARANTHQHVEASETAA